MEREIVSRFKGKYQQPPGLCLLLCLPDRNDRPVPRVMGYHGVYRFPRVSRAYTARRQVHHAVHQPDGAVISGESGNMYLDRSHEHLVGHHPCSCTRSISGHVLCRFCISFLVSCLVPGDFFMREAERTLSAEATQRKVFLSLLLFFMPGRVALVSLCRWTIMCC